MVRLILPTLLLLSLSACKSGFSSNNDSSSGLSNFDSRQGAGMPAPGAAAAPTPFPVVGDFKSIPSNFNVAQYLETWPLPNDEGAGDPVGAFRMVCKASHEGYDDPIVYPGQPGKSHLHQFYGNTMTDAHSTYESLRTTGMSTCNGPLNRSAYWIPAMMNPRGQVVRPDFITIYYKRYPKTSPNCKEAKNGCANIPRGLRMVFGFNFTTKKLDLGAAIIYRCKGPGKPDVVYSSLTAAAQNCGVGNHIDLSIGSPPCWDGVHLDSPDHRSHLAYEKNYWDPVKGSYFSCPDTHPYLLPQISVSPEWSVDSDLDTSGTYVDGVTKTWSLSSDMMGATKEPGETFHADWFGAWDDDILQTWEDNCLDKHLSCQAGDLGNGTHMKFFEGFTTDPANPHAVDAPPMPATMDMSTMHH